MGIHVALRHKTTYLYDRPVSLDPHLVRLRPAPHCRTPILSYSLSVSPDQHFINWQQDAYANYQARLVFPELARKLEVEVDLVADMTVINPFDFFIEDTAEHFPFPYAESLARELGPFLEIRPAGPRLEALVAELRRENVRTVDYLVEINQHLSNLIEYVIRLEPGIQAPEETLTLGRGSCRDSAWLLVQLLRRLGLAARFASGYLIQLTPDEKSLTGPSGPASDFTDLHAWTEVFVPGAGWLGLDPTSGLAAGEGHIPLACAADPLSASPIQGSFRFLPSKPDEKVSEEFGFEMELTRIEERPRVTKPYTEAQWNAILACGSQLDRRLIERDVRLTMGGEPTFVAVDARDEDEWNVTALGPQKRELAGALLRRLRARFAPGALLHFGQGKQYPGESLPRWALSCIWRKDGAPLWTNPEAEADETVDYGFGVPQARQFLGALGKRLGVGQENILPGFEDTAYYLWQEGRLPVNVSVNDARLDDAELRERLRRVFDQGLGAEIGVAMPLCYSGGWMTRPWNLRREHLFLIPGDSAMGYRLPLNTLPWVDELEYPYLEPPDPFGDFAPLTSRQAYRVVAPDARQPLVGQSAPWVVRTALCVEPRDGCLYVFIPPLEDGQAYVELVEAIEATAAQLGMPCLMEGYAPLDDPRLGHFAITPDPGVMEVNIHPSSGWEELVDKTQILYEEARQVGLGAEKFALDGRHVGTGGGNHVLLGGPTPEDSPILRRPDLLSSLLTFWNHHPSLSYVFSSQFIGPTSQAPRVDEARADAIHELELAFAQLPEPGQSCQPWLVDRVFRHLLVDLTGNTHRAEFCIDKLYSPDGPSGRRGLVEMRSLEMPPHYQMSLAQQLLLRSLVAYFWDRPYQKPLVEWGSELHDRFMLGHFAAVDLCEVLAELRDYGLPLQDDWFAPHLEFRYPLIGRFASAGLEVELREAIEPWHVLGEQPGMGGAVRYVDSSLERIQVKLRGMVDPRHRLACNGIEVPLHPTGVNGEFVAGVRFRAWQPASCLHPTIGVHSPLVFDVFDTWSERAVGGCTYHVAHPGGRSYDRFPVNAYEAEARRSSRFLVEGHTPGGYPLRPAPKSKRYPFTLDLRWLAPLPG